MGLDVHLYKIQKPTDNLPQDIEDNYNYYEAIEEPSSKYPKHMFRLGYFRSSYNDTGLNNVSFLRYNKEGLYYIFGLNNLDIKDYYINVDWRKSRRRAIVLLNKFKKDPLKMFNISFETVWPPQAKSVKDTLDYFCERYAEVLKAGLGVEEAHGEFTCGFGHFYVGSPVELYAVCPVAHSNRQGLLVITKSKQNEKLEFEWYIQALEIVIETINFVINSGEENKYVLGWSS